MKTPLLTLVLLFSLLLSFSQPAFPPLSPKGILHQQVGNTQLSIEYERPSARDRKIFGELVPWNEVWRTGAGYCTKISFDTPVKIGKQHVAPGTYALLTLPSPDQWMVILNTDTSLYGAFKYDPAKDVARFPVVPEQSTRYYETLTIDVDLIPNHAMIYISWANTSIHFPFETFIDEEIERYLYEELVNQPIEEIENVLGTMTYLYYQRKDFKLQEQLALKALEQEPNLFVCLSLMECYEYQQYLDKALAMAKQAIAIRKSQVDKNPEYMESDLAIFQKNVDRIAQKIQALNPQP